MTLASGSRLGSYEILSPLGAGGMGEVWKAKDMRLDRFVAVKVLPEHLSKHPESLARFEREAKAVAALNHPNILGIHDFATQGDTTYVVMELLEGESLRTRLEQGPMTPRKATELAIQMAQGLAAAHEKGVVHRDLKPDNLWITKEGRLKILDFGLAKQMVGMGAGSDSFQPTAAISPGHHTEQGMILGTMGYMSPEQVRGEAVDARTDLFSFGAVLFEMLTGKRAFARDNASDTMAAILRDDPPEMEASGKPIPLVLRHIIDHCLEKAPARRFRDAHDVAFALENLSSASESPAPITAPFATQNQRTTWIWAAVAAAAVLVAGFAGWAFRGGPATPPTFQRLTFLPGTIEAARFGPDGRTVYFSQRVAGGKPEIFVLNPGAPEPRSLGLTDALLLAVSPTNELAFLRDSRLVNGHQYAGILARAPGGGGAPREVQEGIAEAVWDGDGLATLTSTFGVFTNDLTFPAGKPILKADSSTRVLANLRISADGARLALTDSDSVLVQTEIIVYDREGRRRTLLVKPGDAQGDTLTGLAWGPGGELWYSELQGDQTALWALSMSGRQRPLWRGQGVLQLQDVSREGHLLLAQHQVRRGVLAQKAGETTPRDLSILGSTQAAGMSADGRSLLLVESPASDGPTAQDVTYLRPLDGGPALRLGRGWPYSLSADGRWVQLDAHVFETRDLDPAWVAALQEAGLKGKALEDPKARNRFLLFVPTGLGRPFALALPPGSDSYSIAFPLPDARHVVATIELKGQYHWALLDRQGGEARIIAPEIPVGDWVGLVPLSPDGTRLVLSRDGITWLIQSLAGGEPRPIQGMLSRERPVGWTADGAGIYVRPELSVLPVTISRVDLVTGARKQIMSLKPPDPAGHIQVRRLCMTPDARVFAFTYEKKLSELYLVEGLK